MITKLTILYFYMQFWAFVNIKLYSASGLQQLAFALKSIKPKLNFSLSDIYFILKEYETEINMSFTWIEKSNPPIIWYLIINLFGLIFPPLTIHLYVLSPRLHAQQHKPESCPKKGRIWSPHWSTQCPEEPVESDSPGTCKRGGSV